ncbi:MAG: hypothetical protein GY716_10525 [bacterium]|nr:hypothetical protein [bacterium]
MKTRKLLERLAELTSNSEAKKQKEREAMKALLKALKKRQKKLEEQLATDSGHKKKRLRSKIKVIQAQRKKGIERYKQLRKR